jgi:hypothetical protein
MGAERESSSSKGMGKASSSFGKISITRARAGEIRSSLHIKKADTAMAMRALHEVTTTPVVAAHHKVSAPKSHSVEELETGGGVGRKQTK